MSPDFEWDEKKSEENLEKHGVSFDDAQHAFRDSNRLIIGDTLHSTDEKRWFCVGNIGTGIVTVRFTMRGTRIRIFGAGYWRKMRRLGSTTCGMYYQQKGRP